MSHNGNLKYMTHCRICGQRFMQRQMDVPIIGQPPSAKVQEFVNTLYQHLANTRDDRHRAAFEQVKLFSGLFMGFLAVSLFNSEDPAMQDEKEKARAQCAVVTRKNGASDTNIQESLAKAGFTAPEIERIMPSFQDMRDYLLEIGKYQSQYVVLAPPSQGEGIATKSGAEPS